MAAAARLRSQHGDAATEILAHLMRAARADLNRSELDHLALVFRHLTRDGADQRAPAGNVASASGAHPPVLGHA